MWYHEQAVKLDLLALISWVFGGSTRLLGPHTKHLCSQCESFRVEKTGKSKKASQTKPVCRPIARERRTVSNMINVHWTKISTVLKWWIQAHKADDTDVYVYLRIPIRSTSLCLQSSWSPKQKNTIQTCNKKVKKLLKQCRYIMRGSGDSGVQCKNASE